MSRTSTSIDTPKTTQVQATGVIENKIRAFDPEFSGETVIVTINRGEGELGKAPVYLNVNSSNVLIPRNTKCEIPKELFEALENAKIMEYSTDAQGKVSEAEVQRYAYVVHGYGPQK